MAVVWFHVIQRREREAEERERRKQKEREQATREQLVCVVVAVAVLLCALMRVSFGCFVQRILQRQREEHELRKKLEQE